MIEANGAEIVVRLLERFGVSFAAGIPGGSILPVYDALVTAGVSLRHILVRQEQAAGFFAQGIARSTGRPGVCFATSGPGAMNLLTAVADARADSVPLLVITGQVNTECIGTDAFQEVDTFGLSFPITKHSVMVKSAAELPETLAAAFALAQAGRPGPVLVDIPRNVQLEKASFSSWPDPAQYAGRFSGSRSSAAETVRTLAQAVTLLSSASRPVVFSGGGCNSPEASAALLRLLEVFPAPVVSTLMGLGSVPAGHPLFLGMVGMHGTQTANRAVHGSDVLLAVGARFDDRATGEIRSFCPSAKIIQIDVDAAEIDKLLPSALSVVSPAAPALSALAEQLAGCRGTRARRLWIETVQQDRETEQSRSCSAVNAFLASVPAAAARAGVDPQDIIVTTDVGQHQMWAAQSWPVSAPRRFLTSGSLGTMGFGLPAAMGAAAVHPEKRVLCFSGDGSIQMNVQELATLAENDFSVTVFVLDNGMLGMIRQQQDFSFGGRHSACVFSRPPDLLRVAAAYGIPAVEAGAPGWENAAFQGRGPRFVRLRVDPSADVLPYVVPGDANINSRTRPPEFR